MSQSLFSNTWIRNEARTKFKTTRCAPYKREKIISSTIMMFCPVNFDNTNLRKQTNVPLLGQASLTKFKIEFEMEKTQLEYIL